MESKGFQSHPSFSWKCGIDGLFREVSRCHAWIKPARKVLFSSTMKNFLLLRNRCKKEKAYFGCLKVKQFNSSHCQACRASWLSPAFLFVSEPASEQEKCGSLQCFCFTKPRLANSSFNSVL